MLARYDTDTGKQILVFLKIRWREKNTLPSKSQFFLREVNGASSCHQEVTPRKVVGIFTDGESFSLPYPFRPDTPEWYQFWQEILSNPLIAEVRGIGEKVNYV